MVVVVVVGVGGTGGMVVWSAIADGGNCYQWQQFVLVVINDNASAQKSWWQNVGIKNGGGNSGSRYSQFE